MGVYEVKRYVFSCESMNLSLEDEGKGREIANHCYGNDEYETMEDGKGYGWKIISNSIVFCPYCSKPENMVYLKNCRKYE